MPTKNNNKWVTSEVRVAIQQKLRNVIEKNHKLKTMTKISMILTGNSESMDGLLEELIGEDLKLYKKAPMRSTYVKRSFFRYKNFKQIVVVQWNNLTGIIKNKFILYLNSQIMKIIYFFYQFVQLNNKPID